MNNNIEWHKHFMEIALLLARKSRDNSLGVGCVIVGPDNEIRSTGYNGFPRGVNYKPSRVSRPDKYVWTEHAERNAIYNAARIGVSLKDCTAYITCTDNTRGGHTPCAECARALIQSGIKEIIEYYVGSECDSTNRPWVETLKISEEMLKESGVKITRISYTDCFEVEK